MANAKENDPISVSLKCQLVNRKRSRLRDENDEESSIDSRLISSVRRILESKIEFEKVPGYSSAVQQNLKGKYRVLAPPKKYTASSGSEGKSAEVKITTNVWARKQNDMGISPKKSSVDSTNRDSPCPPVPSASLFPESAVKLGWQGNEPVGAGMINLGNTCYLNSTLQALFHVPSFCNWLSSETVHNGTGKCDQAFISGDMCTICAMAATLRVARAQSGSVIKPALIYGRLRSICKHLSHGHQEDAHEFLRFLIESMERTFLLRFKGKKLDNLSKETTPLHRIFGGYLRNEVMCHSCGRVSTTFQLFQDLFLDIRQSNTLLESMQTFFSREKLEGDESKSDSYKCEKCKCKGNCTKRVYVQIPPKVLCIQLKRFTALGKKIMKHISYPLKLDLSPYVYVKTTSHSNNNTSPLHRIRHPVPYKLVSIVSHYGTALNCGHYTAVGRSAKGSYCIFDDSQVRLVSLNSALGASAYILMYEMEPGWHIGLESKGNQNIEKVSNGSLKIMNSSVKPLSSATNFQKSQITTMVNAEVKSSPSLKPITSLLQSNNGKIMDAPFLSKNLNSSSSSNAESTFRKPSHPKHENFGLFSKSPQGQTKPTLNGLVSRETSATKVQLARVVSPSQKESKSSSSGSLPLDQTKQPASVTQKQLLPKLLSPQTSPIGANTFYSKANNHEQNHLKPLKLNKCLNEASCHDESVSVKQQILPVSKNSASSNNAYQKECPSNSVSKSRNLQPFKRSHSPSLGSEDNKQTDPVHKKQQVTLPYLLYIKNNQLADDTKTSSQHKIKTLKDWLVDRNSVTGKNAENETKQLHQEVSTKSLSGKQTVISTVGGWKVTELDLSSRSRLEVGLKRKLDVQEEVVVNKKKRDDKVVSAEVWRTLSQSKIPFLNSNSNRKKENSIDGRDRHKEKINGVSAPNQLMSLAQQNDLFQKM